MSTKSYHITAIGASLTYFRGTDGGIKTILLGGILVYLGSIYLIPAVFVMGYLIRVLRSVADGDADPPTFTEWGELFVTGVKAYVIWAAYFFLPIVNVYLMELTPDGTTTRTGLFQTILVVGSGGGIYSIFVKVADGMFSTVLQEDLAMLEAYGLLVLAMFLAPAAVVQFADTGRLRAGFSFGEIRSAVFRTRYVVAWMLFMVLWSLHLVFLLLEHTSWYDDQTQTLLDELSLAGLSSVGTEALGMVLATGYVVSFVLLVAAFYVVGRSLRIPEQAPRRWPSRAFDGVVEWLDARYPHSYRINPTELIVAVCLFSFGLFVTGVLLMGYFVSVIRHSMAVETRGDVFDNWRGFFFDGLRGVTVWVGYLLVPVAVWVLWLFSSVNRASNDGRLLEETFYWTDLPVLYDTMIVSFSALSVGINPVANHLFMAADDARSLLANTTLYVPYSVDASLLALCGLLFVPVLYLLPAATAMTARSRRVRDGFSSDILPYVVDPSYAKMWRKVVLTWFFVTTLWVAHHFVSKYSRSTVGETITIIDIPVAAIATPSGLALFGLWVVFTVAEVYILILTSSVIGRHARRRAASSKLPTTSVRDVLRPRRSYTFPFVVFATSGVARLWWTALSGTLAEWEFVVVLSAAHVAASYLAAVVVHYAFDLHHMSTRSPLTKPLFAPSRTTIRVLAVFAVVYVVGIAASALYGLDTLWSTIVVLVAYLGLYWPLLTVGEATSTTLPLAYVVVVGPVQFVAASIVAWGVSVPKRAVRLSKRAFSRPKRGGE